MTPVQTSLAEPAVGLASVALNGRFSGTKDPTGTQTVAYNLFDAIIRLPRDFTLTIFADSRFKKIASWKTFSGVRWVEVPFQSWTRYTSQLWEQFVFPVLARKLNCTVAHHPINTSPIWSNGLKQIVTLHDLNFIFHHDWYSWSFRTFLRRCVIPSLLHSERVCVVSEYVKKQVTSYLKLDPLKIQVIHNGVTPIDPRLLQRVVYQQDSEKKYILCVGALQPHKNLTRLVSAFQILRAEGIIHELKVVGRPQRQLSPVVGIKKLLAQPGITQTGYLGEEELFQVYSQSAVFCYPSLEEGFGLPVLEAMRARTLVVTSNTSSLPEVAGPSAILVDPFSVEDIARGLRQCLTMTPTQRQERLTAGEAWVSKFTWESAAPQYIKVYQQLLAEVPSSPRTFRSTRNHRC